MTQTNLRYLPLAALALAGLVACQNANQPAESAAVSTETAPTAAEPSVSPTLPAPAATSPVPAPRPQGPAAVLTAKASPVVAAKPVPVPVKPLPARVVTIPAGTPIRVRAGETLSTKTATAGDRFSGTLAEDLLVNDTIVAKRGATVGGLVADADPGGRVKGVASISVRFNSLELANGETATISTNSFVDQAKSTKKKDAVKVGIASGIGAAIGAIAGGGRGAAIGAGAGAGAGTGVVLATHGEPAVIPVESVLRVNITEPVDVHGLK